MNTEDDKKAALKKIEEKTKAAMALIKECEDIATEHDVSFSFDIAYGMGGSFYPNEEDQYGNKGWHASSQSC